jgi:hypothetical protein
MCTGLPLYQVSGPAPADKETKGYPGKMLENTIRLPGYGDDSTIESGDTTSTGQQLHPLRQEVIHSISPR